MRANNLPAAAILFSLCLLTAAACTPPSEGQATMETGTASPVPQTATEHSTVPPSPVVIGTLSTKLPEATKFPIPPTPTVEPVEDNPTWVFHWYRVVRAVNVRAGTSIDFDILDVLQPGNEVLVYDVAVFAGGYEWGWVLDDRDGVLSTAGWSVISSNSTIWLERLET